MSGPLLDKRKFIGQTTALGFSATALVLNGTQLRAQTPAYPNKPIRYIVPVSAGGGSDMVGRAVAERLSKALYQPVVVENIGGGGGLIACQALMKAAPDGYTLLQGYVATHGTSPATRKLPYDPIKDFVPVGLIGATPNVLIVNTSIQAKTIQEFIAYLKKNPAKFSYGSAGAGSLTHLTGELFKIQTGSFMLHIPYRGIAPAITDLIGGQTQAMFPGLAAALPHLKSGRVRALAVTGTSRHPALPDTPTLEEVGLKGFDAQQWYGVVAPVATPASIVAQLNQALAQVLSQTDFKAKLSAEAVEPKSMTQAQFGEFMKSDFQRWQKLASERNIRLEE